MNRAEIRGKEWQFPFVAYYPSSLNEKLPLVVQLHGAGETGDGEGELTKVEKHGFSPILSIGEDLPCIVVMPQCKPETFWGAEIPNLYSFLIKLFESYPIDQNRVYLVGISMGAYGTWLMASRYPDMFAAIAPVCGGGMPWKANVLKMPIWAFHGTEDDIVNPTESLNMIKKIRQNPNHDPDVRLTMLDGVAHNAWDYAFNKDLLEWLLSKHK